MALLNGHMLDVVVLPSILGAEPEDLAQLRVHLLLNTLQVMLLLLLLLLLRQLHNLKCI